MYPLDALLIVNFLNAFRKSAWTNSAAPLDVDDDGTVDQDDADAIRDFLDGSAVTFVHSGVTSIHVRTHEHDDSLTVADSIVIPVIAIGGHGRDSLTSGGGNDFLDGGAGADTLNGGSGHDLIAGRASNDVLQGGSGNDSLLGLQGKDQLYGEANNDLLYGGSELDTLTDTLGTNTLDQDGRGAAAMVQSAPARPHIAVEAATPTLLEDSPSPGQFVFRRSGDASEELTVTYTVKVTSTATAEDDYDELSGELVLGVNQREVVVEVTPSNDDLNEGDEVIFISVDASETLEYTVDADFDEAAMTLVDNDQWLVSLTPMESFVAENGTRRGRFTVERSGSEDLTYPLTVNYVLDTGENQAIEGTDFNLYEKGASPSSAYTGSVTIPAGQKHADIEIEAIDNQEVTATKSVYAKLVAAPKYVAPDLVENVQIVDDDNDEKDINYCSCQCTVGCVDVGQNGGNNAIDVNAGQQPPPSGGVPLDSMYPVYPSYLSTAGEGAVTVIAQDVNMWESAPASMLEVTVTLGSITTDPIYFATGYKFGATDVVLKSNGKSLPRGSSKDMRRIAVPVDTSSLDTGRYDWELTVKRHYYDKKGNLIAEQTTTDTYAGHQKVRNRQDSPYGDGWAMQNVDRLVFQTDGILLDRGDGNMFWYKEVATDTYERSSGEFEYSTLVYNSSSNTYVMTSHAGPNTGYTATFDADGLLVERQDNLGNAMTYTYNAQDALATVTDTVGRTTTFSYDAMTHVLTSYTDFAGRTTSVEIDENNLVESITNPDPDGAGPLTAATTTFEFHTGTSLLASVKTPATEHSSGEETTFEYDDAGTLIERKHVNDDPSTFTSEITYGLPATGTGTLASPAVLMPVWKPRSTATDGSGNTTQYTTDRFGYTENTILPLQLPILARTTIPTETLDLGEISVYTLYSEELLVKALKEKPDSFVGKNAFVYKKRDAEGRVTEILESGLNGHGSAEILTTRIDYDNFGNVTKVTNPDGSFRTFDYDPVFHKLERFVDELGATTLYDVNPTTGLIDSARQILGGDDALGDEVDPDVYVRFSYTPAPTVSGEPPAGLLETTTQYAGLYAPQGRVTRYDYDEKGLLDQVTYAEGTPDETYVAFTYDAYDQVETMTELVDIQIVETVPVEITRTTTFVTDRLGRITKMTAPDPDGAGPLAAPVTDYVYDAQNRLIKITDPLLREIEYIYDTNGRLEKIITPDHDEDSNKTEILYDYDTAGRLLSTSQSVNGVERVESYGYDALNRMIALTGPTVEGGEPEMSEYLNLQGLPLWSTDPADRKTNFSYSNFGQTVTTHYVNPVTGTPLSGITDVVEYDSVGNLVRVTDTLGRVTDYEYDELHRLTRMILPDADLQDALSRPDVSYKYDTFGNLREVTDAKGYVTSYFYDNLDRLIRVEQPRPHDFEDVPVTEFAYNRAGEMVSATDALGNTTTYDYDFLGRMIRVEMPDPDGAGSLTAPVMIYAYDAAGQVETETSTDLGRSAGSPDSL